MVSTQSRKAPPDLVLAEGIRVLEEAVKSGHEIDSAFFHDDFGSSAREARLINTFRSRSIRVMRAPKSLLARISDVASSQGALALLRIPVLFLSDLSLENHPLLVCADAVQDPGNLGTLCRTARAAGVSAFFTTTGAASLRTLKTIRSSAGSLFHLPWIENLDRGDILQYCREHCIKLYRSSASGGRPYPEVDYRSGGAIILGNESRGISESDWPEADCIHIPMTAGVESLNVAAAGAVILFEAFRQRSDEIGK